MRRLAPALAATALLALAPGAGASPFRVSLGSAARRAFSSGFLGLALEYRAVPSLVGPDPAAVDPVMVQLLRNLDPSGHPVLRIGGQSTDRSWWPVSGMRRPLGVTYDLSPSWMATVRALVGATGARLIPSLPLEPDRPRIDAVEAAQLERGLGRRSIEALEIGNEPELYGIVPWYRVLNNRPIPWYSKQGSPVYARPRAYGPAQFAGDFARAAAAVPRLPLAGPDTGIPQYMDQLAVGLSRRSRVRILTWHSYGLNQCVTDPSSPGYPSVPHLLSLHASRGIATTIGPYVAAAHAAGASFRIDEMNSVTCNGRLGVSNTFASALWLLDALFHVASEGVDGVNIHTYPNAANGLFDFARSGGQWRATVYPIYYGALLFAQAAPPGSRLLRVHSPTQYQVRAWATRGRDRTVRVLLINVSLHHPHTVRVAARGATASLERLSARSAYATGGVALGGQGFGTATATGVLAPPQTRAVARRGGAYSLTLPPSSATLLTIPPR